MSVEKRISVTFGNGESVEFVIQSKNEMCDGLWLGMIEIALNQLLAELDCGGCTSCDV